MVKKRVWLAVILLVLAIISAGNALAGCCVGVTSCSTEFFESECSALSYFDAQDCTEISDCDIVACCHDVFGIPKATFRATCTGIAPEAQTKYLSPFRSNPTTLNSEADIFCSGVSIDCGYNSCEQANSPGCGCGSTLTTTDNPYCCAADGAIFSNPSMCQLSPSCTPSDGFDIVGRVLNFDDVPIPGVTVTAAGKTALTDSDGWYTLSSIPDGSSGNIVAEKNGVTNSTAFAIVSEDFGAEIIYLDIATIYETENDCFDGKDDDGDQFGWKSIEVSAWSGTDHAYAADRCDPDCAEQIETSTAYEWLHVASDAKVVTSVYYSTKGEFDADSSLDLCTDLLDNDCDGATDCDDEDCDDSPACQNTFCGDNEVQFPNADGLYEQCDASYDEFGELIEGDDSICPGMCYEPGSPKECTCFYESVCGNGVVEAPLEECEGVYVASLDKWTGESAGSSANQCVLEKCGTPTSPFPCQCHDDEYCGNGFIEEEAEDCDPGTFFSHPEWKSNDATASDGHPDYKSPNWGSCGQDKCSPNCKCESEQVCGDGIIQPGEHCDGVWQNAQSSDPGWPEFLNVGYWSSFKTIRYGCQPTACGPPLSAFEEFDDFVTLQSLIGNFDVDDRVEAYDYVISETGLDSCKCPMECEQSPSRPVLKEVEATQWEKHFDLSWTDECLTENVLDYNVYRCRTPDPDALSISNPSTSAQCTIVNDVPIGQNTEYSDSSFAPRLPGDDPFYYCYMVEGIYDTISSDNIKYSELDTSLHCVPAGDLKCYTLQSNDNDFVTEFCFDNDRKTCDDYNRRVPAEADLITDIINCSEQDPEMFCVGPFLDVEPLGETKCIDISPCSMCSDPFGIFSYSYTQSPKSDLSVSDGQGDSDDYGVAPLNEDGWDSSYSYTSCIELATCYFDYSHTSTDTFQSLVGKSCYDMHSPQACAKFNATADIDNKCQWKWSDKFGELGFGVCSAINPVNQECDICHDPLNEVFGMCDKDSCSLYGRCYYDQGNVDEDDFSEAAMERRAYWDGSETAKRNYYQCRHERELACENYDAPDDCVNSDSPYSLDGEDQEESEFDLDVDGTVLESTFFKESGSHEVDDASDDYFSFGKCQWRVPESGDTYPLDVHTESGACIKNSDNSAPYERTNEYDRHYVDPYSDCGGVWAYDLRAPSDLILNITRCRQDLTEPETELAEMVEDPADPEHLSANFEIRAIVDDDSIRTESLYVAYNSLSFPRTFACIAEKSGSSYLDCYPNESGLALFDPFTLSNILLPENINYVIDSYEPFPDEEDSDESTVIGFRTGEYLIKYFSEDASHNLEPVQELHVFLDADAPIVSFSFENTSYEVYEDQWRTNLTINMFINPQTSYDDEYAWCSASLYYDGINLIYHDQSLQENYNNSWYLNYTDMMDGYPYSLNYSCADDVGNVATGGIVFRIEGDRSVTNPAPHGTFNESDTDAGLEVGVETGLPGECRYMMTEADLSESMFSESFSQSTFNSMTQFATTGSAELPRTKHFTVFDSSTLENGFYRFYVKCNIFADNSFHGNAGDMIMFAVDTTPPVSAHKMSGSFYNGWFNGPAKTEITCVDPELTGVGVDWAFGCDLTRYCKGLECWNDESAEMFTYNPSAGITLTESNYISYFSIDAGNNSEFWIKDVFVPIDNTPPVLNITFFRDDNSVPDVLVANELYRVVVNSTKPFIAPSIDSPTLSFSMSPSKSFTDYPNSEIVLTATTDPSVWEGSFYLTNIRDNLGYEGTMTLSAEGIDHHNVSGEGYAQIYVDTLPPDQPVLIPSLDSPSRENSDYQLIGYPLNYVDGVYYTSETSLFLTGYTTELTTVTAVVGDKAGHDAGYGFIQSETNMTYEDVSLFGFEGLPDLKIPADMSSAIDADKFLGFDQEDEAIGSRIDYGAFGTFYDVESIQYVGGDEDYTVLGLTPGLQEVIEPDRKTFFYDDYHPTLWFGIDVPFIPFKSMTFYLKAEDDVGNMARYPETRDDPSRLTFFSDPNPPVVIGRGPNDGSTALTTFDVYIVVKEGREESGLYEDSVEVTIGDVPVSFEIEHDEDLEAQDPLNYYYRIVYHAVDLEDGTYIIDFSGTDKAGSEFDQTEESSLFFITVDTNVPLRPEFYLVDGFQSPMADSTRWFARESPDFVINFTNEIDTVVTISDVRMDTTPTEGDAAECTRITEGKNAFYCVFTEPKTTGESFWADYGVWIDAYKTLTDGSDSPVGSYLYEFTVDDQAPAFDFSLSESDIWGVDMRKRFMDNINLSVFAIVVNEHHTLEAELEILGKTYPAPYSYNSGEFYTFMWEVPDYDKADEGYHDLTLTLTDFAENTHSETKTVYIDLTAPRITDVEISYSGTVPIAGEEFTSRSVVNVSGTLLDDDVTDVWIVPGSYNDETQSYDGQQDGVVIYSDDNEEHSESFFIEVVLPNEVGIVESQFLYNEMVINSINNMTLFARDIAGHTSSIPLRIYRDLAPPLEPDFYVGGNPESYVSVDNNQGDDDDQGEDNDNQGDNGDDQGEDNDDQG